MSKLWPAKDPDEKLDYSHSFAPDLATGETLLPASAFTVVDAAGTSEFKPQEVGTDFIKIWLQGGTEGEQASFTARGVTSNDRIFEETILLPIISTFAAVVHPGDYTPPIPANLIAVYPEFSDVSPITIQINLDKAARAVDESWTEGDFATARMALAAHFMALSGLGGSPEAKAISTGIDGFKVMTSGSLRLERTDKAANATGYRSTRYGQEYCRLLQVNKGGPRVTGLDVASGADGDRSQSPLWGI